jgi:hypothetical protein
MATHDELMRVVDQMKAVQTARAARGAAGVPPPAAVGTSPPEPDLAAAPGPETTRSAGWTDRRANPKRNPLQM